MSEEISAEEEQLAKDLVWKYFLTQYIVGWKTKFPANSTVGRSYMKKEELEFIERVGKALGERALRKSVG